MTSNETAVLEHQLRGIMECWDMTNLFYLLKMSQLYKYQKCRLSKLMDVHLCTNELMIKRYNEIGEIPYEYSSHLKLPLGKTDASQAELMNEVLDSWVKWETSAYELYTTLSNEDTEYRRTWRILARCAQSEMRVAQKVHNKYYVPINDTQPKTRSVRMEMQAKLNAAKNATV